MKDHRHEDLFRMLDDFRARRIRFRRIFLVGDVIESWFFSAKARFLRDRRAFDVLFDRLDAVVVPGGPKHFIVGNHDTTAFSMALAPSIAEYLEDRHWRIESRYEDDHLVVVHGHQGQYSRIHWVASIAVLRVLHRLALVWPALFRTAESFYERHLNHENPADRSARRAFYRRLGRVVRQGDRVLVCGHTHNFLHFSDLRVVNTGDWLASRTFVLEVERKGRRRFVGFRMFAPREYEEAFALPTHQRSSG